MLDIQRWVKSNKNHDSLPSLKRKYHEELGPLIGMVMRTKLLV